MDIYELYGEHYLILVDYYSKYLEVMSLNKNLTSKNIIEKLKSIFARHGVPNIVICDSGTQLISQEIISFTHKWNFEIKPSSPHHQQCNGMAERTIGTIKKLLKKTIDDKEDIYLALLAYRNTPVYNSYTPSQILMSRILRDNMPRTKEQLTPQLINKERYHIKLKEARDKQKFYYDRHTTNRPEFEIKEKIYYQEKPGSIWKPGEIVKKEKDRSYTIKTARGTILRRNKIHLRRRGEEVEVYQNDTEQEERIPNETTNQRDPPISNPTSPDPPNAKTQDITGNLYTTRYGRIITQPIRFGDYVS
ncbi:hypothetical protein Zmor_017041 [Zophobas morio]|uniref:Integrase catalytic domain-containing protein n=1 Tax=Zophobas morio TaxID=2755281 RepID=A0AA38IBP5_9CUCU|nr:hypothetical protein Zmor_017041 [Zophobas morio]